VSRVHGKGRVETAPVEGMAKRSSSNGDRSRGRMRPANGDRRDALVSGWVHRTLGVTLTVQGGPEGERTVMLHDL
jgi:hypothetical protein